MKARRPAAGKKQTVKKAIRIIIIVLLIGALGFSGYKIVSALMDYRVGTVTYDELAEEVVVRRENTLPVKEPMAEGETETEAAFRPSREEAPIEVDFDALLAENGDVIGWLYCEGTPINYPITQSDDNLKYLRHLLNGKYNIAGTLFADYRCGNPFHDRNTVVYGHNLRNEKMFGTLAEYDKREYYDAHPVMWLLTPNGDYKLSVIGGYLTDTSSNIYDFHMTSGDLKAAINTAAQKMPFPTSVDLSKVTRIVTLSTCSYESDDSRYILVTSAEKLD